MRNEVWIYIQIEGFDEALNRNRRQLSYAIGTEQALELRVGRAPPEFDLYATSDWVMRKARADAFARHIAADLAHAIVRAVNPDMDPKI